MSTRCKGCDAIVKSGHKNRKTGEYEDLCTYCRDPQWDGGIVYKLDEFGQYTEEPEYYINESYELERKYSGDTGNIQDTLDSLGAGGSIKIENT